MVLCILWSFIENSSQDFIEELGNSVLFHIFHDVFHVRSMVLRDSKVVCEGLGSVVGFRLLVPGGLKCCLECLHFEFVITYIL